MWYKTKATLVLSLTLLLVGCSTVPDGSLQLSPKSLERRQAQSRKFATTDETKMLIASMEVLQDMGFLISESESKLGVIVAAKTREIDNRAQRFAQITLSLLAGTSTHGIEKTHNIRVSLVTIPDKSKKDTTVRINFQREVIDIHGNLVRRHSLHEDDLYQGFFAKLSKSVFLEAHDVI
ncbi:MAG TPA: hypothetical protein VLG38_03455 [Gammaproteobacteria bacterium]|nr:hypothetical protein [Gammaproteobacteria bacterium]